MIPYSRQNIDDADIEAVTEALSDELITTGPRVARFEKAVCDYVGSVYGVAVSSGTAALHAAMFAIGLKPGAEVIVPAITFVATANCVVFQGAKPVFCDVQPDTLLIDTNKLEALITKRTKAIIAVDYAGQPCDYRALRELAKKYKLSLISDACHSLGAVIPTADITVYSFHPVKHITTGEGGMAVTDDPVLAERMRSFRFHGMQRGMMYELGYNYRISDIQCALGLSQLSKLDGWIAERRAIASVYNRRLSVERLQGSPEHTYHLYVVKVPRRDELLTMLYERQIRATVHYRPVFHHPYYWKYEADCPVAEEAAKQILSLPIFPGMMEQEYVIKTLEGLVWQK